MTLLVDKVGNYTFKSCELGFLERDASTGEKALSHIYLVGWGGGVDRPPARSNGYLGGGDPDPPEYIEILK
jgi:hypothetical protein